MDFRAEQHLAGSVADVERALVDPDFSATLDDLTKIGAPEVLGTARTGDVVEQRIRYRFVAPLPGAVTAVVDPDKLTWVEVARYDLTDHTSTHVIEPDHYADRLEARYACTLVSVGDGSLRTVTGEVHVHVLLVGAKVERAIVDGLVDFAAEQADRLDRWTRGRT